MNSSVNPAFMVTIYGAVPLVNISYVKGDAEYN